MKKRYRLDHIGQLYPAVATERNTTVFRIAVILRECVDPEILQQALDIAIRRFPRFAVRLKKGFLRNYLCENPSSLEVQEENLYPCASLDVYENNGYLFRVLYYNQRIGLEVFHGLTDGIGAMEFLKTLVFLYLHFAGKKVSDEGLILLPEDHHDEFEEEDSYLRYYEKRKKKKSQMKKAYTIKGTIFEPYGVNVTHGLLSASSLNQYARRMGTTIAGYVLSVLIQAIFASSKQDKLYEPVTICIPANLRGFFPSKTLKNFVAPAYISVYVSKDMSFQEIINEVTRQLQENINEENLSSSIASTVKFEKVPGVRFVPLFIKKMVMNQVYWKIGERITMTLSNFGIVKFPASMRAHIEMVESVLYPKGNGSINCSMSTINDRLNISFARNIKESKFLQNFFQLIVAQTGLEVELYSNEWGKEAACFEDFSFTDDKCSKIKAFSLDLYPVYDLEELELKKRG